MIKNLFLGMTISIGWYIGYEICEICHRKIHFKFRDEDWYRTLYGQPTKSEPYHCDSKEKSIYGFQINLSNQPR